jgi:hypothetical protein
MDLQLHPTTLTALVTLTASYGLFWSAVLGFVAVERSRSWWRSRRTP